MVAIKKKPARKSKAKTRANKPLVLFFPPELEPMRLDVRRFIEAMLYKLRKNAKKGRWESIDLNKAFDLMMGEVGELRTAISENNSVEILLEGADCANFALIVSSIAIERGT